MKVFETQRLRYSQVHFYGALKGPGGEQGQKSRPPFYREHNRDWEEVSG